MTNLNQFSPFILDNNLRLIVLKYVLHFLLISQVPIEYLFAYHHVVNVLSIQHLSQLFLNESIIWFFVKIQLSCMIENTCELFYKLLIKFLMRLTWEIFT